MPRLSMRSVKRLKPPMGVTLERSKLSLIEQGFRQSCVEVFTLKVRPFRLLDCLSTFLIRVWEALSCFLWQ